MRLSSLAARGRIRSPGQLGRPGKGAPVRPPPRPRVLPRVPQAGEGSAVRGGGGGAEGRAEGGPGRGASARLREAVRAGAGRVRPPGAVGRAAFLMCHQHVEPARAALRAGGTPLTFEGSRRPTPFPAVPGPCSSGRWRQLPPGPGRVERGPGPRPGARGAPGTSGRRVRLAAAPHDPRLGRGLGGAGGRGLRCERPGRPCARRI